MSDNEERSGRNMSSFGVLGAAGLNFHDWNADLKTALGLTKKRKDNEGKSSKKASTHQRRNSEDDYGKRLKKWEDEANMVPGNLRKTLRAH